MKTLTRVVKIAGYTGGSLVLLMLLSAGLTQTAFFRDRLRAILASDLSTRLNGTIHIGRIGGNLISGFTIDSLAVASGDETILSTGQITCQYEFFSFFSRNLRLRYLILEQPVFRLVRSSSGKWNFLSVIKGGTEGGGGTFDMTMSFNDIELKRGTLTLIDSASLAAPGHWDLPSSFVEYHRFSINDLSAQMGAQIAGREISVKLGHASFYSPQSQFELTHFRGDFSISDKGTTARNVIIQSGRSYIELDAFLGGRNILRGLSLDKLAHDSTQVQLRAKNLDLGELRSFIPQVGFLDGSVYLELDAGGEFGNLLVKHLHLGTLGSAINLSGSVRHLNDPRDLSLNMLVGDTKIDPADISKLLRGLELPTFDSVGKISLYAEFSGKPLTFRAKTIAKGEFGSLDIGGEMNLARARPTYSGTFAAARLNLAPLTGIRKLRTFLTGSGTIRGEGFSLREMNSTLGISVDTCRTAGMAFTTSEITATAAGNRLEATARLRGEGVGAEVRGGADFTDAKMPHYNGTLALTSFDLARLFNNEEYSSSLTVHGMVAGSGHNIDDFDADCDLSLLASVFQGHDVEPQDIHLALDQRNSAEKRLSLRSGIADIDFRGKFDLDLTTAALVHQTNSLIETIKRHALPADSQVTETRSAKLIVRPHTLSERKVNCTYSVNIKNLAPLADLFKASPFDANADLRGTLTGTVDELSVTCEGTFGEFYIGSVKGGVLVNDGRLAIELRNLNDYRTLEDLTGRANLTAQSGRLNTKHLDGIHCKIGYKNLSGDFLVSAFVDSNYTILAIGNASVQPHTYVFDFDTLDLRLGVYGWRNEQDVQCRWDFDGFRIMRGTMRRGSEELSLTGVLHSGGIVDLTAALRGFDLAGINALSRNGELSQPGGGFGGVADADLRVTGTTAEPVIAFRALTSKAHFRKTPIGTVTARIDYSNQAAALDITVRELPADTAPSLAIRGTLPIDLALSGVKERFPDKQEHIEVISDGFDVGVLDPLLVDFDNLSGTIRSNVILLGTPRDPQYSGTISLNDLRFLFNPNNISYSVAGLLQPTGDKIVFSDLVIRNAPYKGKTGEAKVTGSILTRNFQLGEFDLLVNGQLLLMTEATRKRIPSMYGTLYTETDPAGIKINGTLDHPFLSGKLRILDANLIFPPAASDRATSSTLALPYVLVDDTSKIVRQERRISKFYGDTGGEEQTEDERGTRIQSSPLLDRIRYNLRVETRGITGVKMIFTPATSEELYAELEGEVMAVNSQGTPTIYGEIQVAPRSYYNFFKKFDASGKLRFVGQWDNPELDIKATYEGVRQVTEAQIVDPVTGAATEPKTTEQSVIVELAITGPRLNPKLDMNMKVQLRPGAEYVDWSSQAKGGDVQSDVISFIVTGKFRDQLTSKEQQQIANFGSATGTFFASNLLSGIFSEYLRQEFSVIRSVDVSYQGGSFQEGTNVHITAAAGIGQLRVGGKIFNDIGSTNLTYQVNLVRNLFLEIQRKVYSENTEDKRLTNEARLYYRFAF